MTLRRWVALLLLVAACLTARAEGTLLAMATVDIAPVLMVRRISRAVT